MLLRLFLLGNLLPYPPFVSAAFFQLLDIVGPEEPEWGAKIKQGSQVLVREGSSNGGEDGKGGHLRLGKVCNQR